MSEYNPQDVVDDLEAIDRDRVEAEVWHRPVPTNEGGFVPGSFSYIGVEIVPADTTDVLNDVLKEHGLVIRSVDLGAEGFRATLTYEGLMHGSKPTRGNP